MANRPITFIVTGQEYAPGTPGTRGSTSALIPSPVELALGRLKQSVSVGVGRGAGGEVPVEAIPDEDVVVLQIANGPTLMLHPETARELMLAQGDTKKTRGANGGEAAAPDQVPVPAQLFWRGLEEATVSRGTSGSLLGRVLLSAVHVLTGLGSNGAAKRVAEEVARKVDAQVESGVYRLKPDQLPVLKGSGAVSGIEVASHPTDPLLVLIHGTFSNTSGTFGKLWSEHPDLVESLFKHYGGRVYGLEHPTLHLSPIDNALLLAQNLPKDARVHLVTHSRGGLVAEVLARASGNETLPEGELQFFAAEGWAEQREKLQQLAAVLNENQITVDRIVRVACPARGTLLASKRLDAYLSIFKWTLEVARIPVAPVLIEFLAQVAKERTDPAVLPGLAAQIPNSPLIQWIHAVDHKLRTELRVVAGDGEGDSITSWLKTLMSDAFYWTDNDLVVQTRSMYGGAPREKASTFVLDRGGKVSHFTYFSNPRTATAIVDGLTLDSPEGFSTIGPESQAGESSSGTRAALRAETSTKPPHEKPALFLLPGILGSNLKIGKHRIWLDWRILNSLMRLGYHAPEPDGIEPDGPVDSTYDRLGDFLALNHEVIEFGYDWRKPMEEEARRLAAWVVEALQDRRETRQPVRFLAHSMGGVLARTMQLERPDVWDQMLSQAGARVLMLGTPNAGSWAPMQVLSGDDTFGNLLAFFGAPFRDHEARELMAAFPGFLQLQAGLLDPKLRLNDSAAWAALAAEDQRHIAERSWWHKLELQLRAYRWGVPPQEVLDQAVKLRQRLDAQLKSGFGVYTDRIVMVAGKARFTPDGYELGTDGLVYLDARDDGDGRVTHASLQLPGVRIWQVDANHGSLPEKREAFEGYQQLLETGSTTLLRPLTPGLRSSNGERTVSHVRSRPSRTRTTDRPPETFDELLAPAVAEAAPPGRLDEVPLRITVHNGDLSFIREPLMLGHYRSARVTGTERVIDELIGRRMSDALTAGAYPDLPGSSKLFLNTLPPKENPWQLPRPEAVIVVGLGPEGKLKAPDLVKTVADGVVAWAEREAQREGGARAVFELAATLIGSGGTGISPGQSARLIAKGAQDANRRLAKSNWPQLSHLHLIELYLDRATEAWRALRSEADAAPARYLVSEVIEVGQAYLLRPPDQGYRGSDYDFLSAVTPEHAAPGVIQYTLDTKRARSEVRAQSTQSELIKAMVERASNDKNSDPRIGNTLCRLLLPLEMDPFIGGTSELVIELDASTAAIPWEIFETDTPDTGELRPWAIRSKLVRKLRTDVFREQVRDAGLESNALVIGEPLADSTVYPPLPGARAEAAAVAQLLMGRDALGPERVQLLSSTESTPGPNSQTVMNTLLDKGCSWRIVHIAGHGEPAERVAPLQQKQADQPQKYGGVVLSDRTFLGPNEIRSMRVVPELVFVNCCHLAAFTPDRLVEEDQRQLGDPYHRPRFASGVAEELIKIGVRCVVAAGWAVDDEPARLFAESFYGVILRGDRFIDAVAAAREAAWQAGGNTWAAYQCYGDPEWSFWPQASDAQAPPDRGGSDRASADSKKESETVTAGPAQEFAGVGSWFGLVLALEKLSVESRYQNRPDDVQQMKIRHLEGRFWQRWSGIGRVAEAFAAAWNDAGNRAKAIQSYKAALEANDGTASIRAVEQLGNLLVRQAAEVLTETPPAGTQEEAPKRRRPRKPRTKGASV